MKSQQKEDPVNKIREIVFGTQMRDYDQRFAELGNRLTGEVGNLKNDIKQRLDGLEALIRNEVSGAIEKINQEKLERNDMIDNVTALMQDSNKRLAENITNLDDQVYQNFTVLKKDLQQQGDQLSERMNREVEDLSSRLTAGLNRVTSDKVARQDLGELLADVASKLKDHANWP